ncbi:hypothetical protein QNO08_09815 [Arthrobacter sp. zg-Y820]|uniref:hypothetical protein n=1 Tax=unclassified Arthrobacter TaxID=235627 RepID=UPI001E4479E3|nr:MULTISPECIES: hypothetical protein [unclassified Arthrobacter]MCC9196585.1 hypothetical protein [Arthrobacter sp. zg-Y820]MDK1279447.1 hypothetical protein [Arthrobacter sp. zg.Y820]WIB08173.1 hypothetical protein QNO08_09815 [Arthrobacter sp. zg-Y820]
MTVPQKTGATISSARPRLSWTMLVLAAALWLGLWYLTPGLLANGAGKFFTSDADVSILIETNMALIIVIVLLLAHPRYNRVLFAHSRSGWLYALPLALALTVPFRYELEAPVALYMFWMTVSVFWQNYLTFGLLQSYLRERMPLWGVLVASAVMFWIGHAVFLPQSFAPVHVLPSLSILALGFVLASLRLALKTLHLNLALHLSFYFFLVA